MNDHSPETTAANSFGVTVTDVNASLWSYIKKHYWWELAILVILVAAWEVAVLVFIAPVLFRSGSNGSNNGRAVGDLVILPISLFLAWWWRLKKRFENSFLSQFAQANGFAYDAQGSVDETYGTIFRIAGRSQVSDVVSGSYKGAGLRLFLHDLTVGSGRNRRIYRNTVIELDLNGRLPNLMLVSRRSLNSGLNLAASSGIKNRLSLEGDFDQRFTLYAPVGTEVEALEIFAPDIMALVEDESRGYDVEFVANRIYIYVNKYITTSQSLAQAFELARLLVDKVGPIAGRLQQDSAIPSPPVNLIAHRQGKTLSRPAEAIYVAVVVLFIIIVIISGVAASRRQPTGSTGSFNQSQNPAYEAAINQAMADDASSNLTTNYGSQIAADGQQALAAAQTNLGRSGAQYWIGIGYFWQRLYDTALTHEQQALTEDPKNSGALIVAGDLLVNTGQYQAAIAMADRELAIDPNDASAYRVMAFAQANLGQRSVALADMDKASAIDQAPSKKQYLAGDAQDRALIENAGAGKLFFDPS